MAAEELRGKRVTLRPATEEDVPALAAIFAEPAVATWWPDYDEARVRSELGEALTILVDGAVAEWLFVTEEADPQFPCVSLDIALGTAFQDQGYGTETLRLAIRHHLDRGCPRFAIDPAVDNERAIRAYEAVGFKPVGVQRRYERVAAGVFRDGLLMDLLPEDFREG
jgi:aminoglycoside 6'-N-acetyltransferase